jgi:hypothetical protein
MPSVQASGPSTPWRYLDRLAHRLLGLGQVGADELVRVLDHPAVDDDRVHVTALGLEGHVA